MTRWQKYVRNIAGQKQVCFYDDIMSSNILGRVTNIPNCMHLLTLMQRKHIFVLSVLWF